jgi:lipoprotein NlpD
LWLLLLAGLTACGQMRPPGGAQVINYAVQPGDTLYSISWRYGYDYRQVAAWNRIRAPYTLTVGQVIRIIPPYQQTARTGPTPAETAAARSRPVEPTSSTPEPAATTATPPPTSTTASAPSQSKPSPRPAPSRPAPATTTVQKKAILWEWPVQGTQKYAFNPNAGKKGIGITGSLGQAVHAAADGDVVYSGSGLIGYGNLLIIKHDDIYLSAYGHNRRLLVKEGSKVKRGQKIAEMGESNKDGVVLHFEIRRDGNPVNPRTYLPKTGS